MPTDATIIDPAMSKPTSTPRLYLASASPRRREILDQIGIAHDVLIVPAPPGDDEPQLPDEQPHDYVRRTARDKALRASAYIKAGSHPCAAGSDTRIVLDATRPVLAADTTVILHGQVLGKPVDAADAKRILQALSGSTHAVHTAVVLAWQDKLWEDVSISEVSFATLTSAQIKTYCDSDEPYGKAGAYGIQGKASVFVQHIVGSYTGIMGLPTYETYRILVQAGLTS